MGYPILQSQTAQALVFFLVESSDHITALTGASPTVTISKNGGSFASPSGSISEIGNGWYKVAGNSTDSNTLGPLLLHATATSGDPTDDCFPVVAYNPQDSTRLGLSGLPSSTPANFGSLSIDSSGRVMLAPAGIDAVLVESGIAASASLTNDAGTQLTAVNLRQAVALILAVDAALVSGATTGSSTITYGQTAVPGGHDRIVGAVDVYGNRSSLTLKVPT